MNTFSRSWEMIAESFQVIRKDKKLILFPILSGFSVLIVAAMYFIPLWQLGIVHQYAELRHLEPSTYAWMFLWYCTNYFVIVSLAVRWQRAHRSDSPAANLRSERG